MSNCSEIRTVCLLHPRHHPRLSRLGLLAVLATITGTTVVTVPFVPVDDAQELERLPVRATDPLASELRALCASLVANPNSAPAALGLAWRYFELATAEGDPRYIGYTETAPGPWWRLAAPPRCATRTLPLGWMPTATAKSPAVSGVRAMAISPRTYWRGVPARRLLVAPWLVLSSAAIDRRILADRSDCGGPGPPLRTRAFAANARLGCVCSHCNYNFAWHSRVRRSG